MARVRLLLSETRAAAMPPACIICGRPMAAHVTKMFIWRPKWASLGCIAFFFCLPLALILLTIDWLYHRRMTVDCPMCERHRHYWARRGFWLYGPLSVLAIATTTFAALVLTEVIPGQAFVCTFVSGGALFLLWALSAILIQRNSLRAVEITADDITLEPVHSTFVEMLRLSRFDVKARPDLGWEDYDPYPRAPAR